MFLKVLSLKNIDCSHFFGLITQIINSIQYCLCLPWFNLITTAVWLELETMALVSLVRSVLQEEAWPVAIVPNPLASAVYVRECLHFFCFLDSKFITLPPLFKKIQIIYLEWLQLFIVMATCGQTTRQNCTYFVNPGFPTPYDGTGSCQLTIQKANPGICQYR